LFLKYRKVITRICDENFRKSLYLACFTELEKSFEKIYREIVDRDTILVHHSRGSYKHGGVEKKEEKKGLIMQLSA